MFGIMTSVSSTSSRPASRDDCEGVRRVARAHDLIAIPLEHHFGEGLDGVFVFHQQHDFRAPPIRLDLGRLGEAFLGRDAGQVDSARRPVPFLAVYSVYTDPPLCVTMPYTVDSRSPVPLPAGLVVKNGSKRGSGPRRSCPCWCR